MATSPSLADQATTAQRLTPGLPQDKFGLLRPFSQDLARDFAQGTGDDLLASRVGQVCGSAGEFPWRPELNAFLDRVRNIKNNVVLQEFALTYVSQALATFVPQVLAVAVAATNTGRNLVLVVTCVRAVDRNNQNAKTFPVNVALPLT